MKQFILFSLIILFVACAEESKEIEEQQLPTEMPEQVLRKYQAHMDKNEFEEAKMLSTTGEKERLDAIAEIIAGEPADSTIFTTNFLEINCVEEGEKATCACLVEDFEEKYRDTFILLLQNGQWLVDAPVQEINYDHNEEIEEFIEEELRKESEIQ